MPVHNVVTMIVIDGYTWAWLSRVGWLQVDPGRFLRVVSIETPVIALN